MEEEFCGSDLIMVVKNNYFWFDFLSFVGFIVNGELFKIYWVCWEEEIYGVCFVYLEVLFIDYFEMDCFEIIVFMDLFSVEGLNLDCDYFKKLFFEIEKDYFYIVNW